MFVLLLLLSSSSLFLFWVFCCFCCLSSLRETEVGALLCLDHVLQPRFSAREHRALLTDLKNATRLVYLGNFMCHDSYWITNFMQQIHKYKGMSTGTN